MPLYVYNGGLLVRDGALAAAQQCCCDSCSCDCVCEWTVTVNGIAILPSSGYVNPVAVCHGEFRNRDRSEYEGSTLSLYDSVELGASYAIDCTNGAWTVAVSWVLLSMNEASQVELGERIANQPMSATVSYGVRTYTLGQCDPSGCPDGTITSTDDTITQVAVAGDADCESALDSVAITANCCPPGCPPLDGCNLVVVLNYPGSPLEAINFAASDYITNNYDNCQLSFSIEDVNIESGGDITGLVTAAYDENCNPTVSDIVITRTVDRPENEQSCDDGITDCVEVLVSLDCNPLP